MVTVSQISFPPSSAPEAAMAPTSGDNADKDTGVLDVRKFGAVGDGVADDSEAFKMAWDAACGSTRGSTTILVPHGHSFMIQSTIFTGPCKSKLVFQVINYKHSCETIRV